MRFLHALIAAKATGTWKNEGAEQLLDHHGKEMIVCITDLYDQEQDLIRFIARLKTSRNEVIVFHVLGKQETELGHSGAFTFRDLESGATMKVDTRSQQKQYAERIQQWISASRLSLLEKGVHYNLLRMDEPPDQVLRDFLKARKNLMR
jgi:hypothetical protein